MLVLYSYSLVLCSAAAWSLLDRDSNAAYEFLRSRSHATARDMGLYSEWLKYSLTRFSLLAVHVAVALAAAISMSTQNQFELRTPAQIGASCALVAGALLLFTLPDIAARIRFARFLNKTAGQLAASLINAACEGGQREDLEPARYDAQEGWSAWHPKDEYWKSDRLWSVVVPVVYLRCAAGGSLALPIDWVHFLFWKRPIEIERGEYLPFRGPGGTSFRVERIHGVIGRPEWSVVQADMSDID